MEHTPPDASKDTGIKRSGAPESHRPEIGAQVAQEAVPIPAGNEAKAQTNKWRSGEVMFENANPQVSETSGEVNMEASITADDVIRAGGFGARDDISSFLPVASDSTDFEASIRDARGYEGSQGEVCRPGLGWTKESKTK